MRIKLKKLYVLYNKGRLAFSDVYATWQSWHSYAQKFNAYHTIQNMANLYTNLFIREGGLSYGLS